MTEMLPFCLPIEKLGYGGKNREARLFQNGFIHKQAIILHIYIIKIQVTIAVAMEEGTIKTPIPKCRLYWSFLFGVVKHFCRFSESGQKQSVILLQNKVQHNSTPPPPPPPPTQRGAIK